MASNEVSRFGDIHERKFIPRFQNGVVWHPPRNRLDFPSLHRLSHHIMSTFLKAEFRVEKSLSFPPNIEQNRRMNMHADLPWVDSTFIADSCFDGTIGRTYIGILLFPAKGCAVLCGYLLRIFST